MGSTCNSRLGNFARTSISFVCYDRGIFEYFAGQQSCVFRRTFRQSRAGRGHYYVCMTSAVVRVPFVVFETSVFLPVISLSAHSQLWRDKV